MEEAAAAEAVVVEASAAVTEIGNVAIQAAVTQISRGGNSAIDAEKINLPVPAVVQAEVVLVDEAAAAEVRYKS